MTKDARAYFAWLVSRVEPINRPDMTKLYEALFYREFQWILERDGNRAEDGVTMRKQFTNETGYILSDEEYHKPCSVLEMMVALAERCDNATMTDFDDREPWVWFDEMLKSLGLENMTDNVFNPEKVDDILTRFLERKYTQTGKGGLFYIPHAEHDMRKIEIWYQMNMYIIDHALSY